MAVAQPASRGTVNVNRICKRCLLTEVDASYVETLRLKIRSIAAELKVEQTLYDERLVICKTCDKLVDGLCRACGCYVELRAVMKKHRCPYDKWPAV